MKPAFISPLLKNLADKAGVQITLEPLYGYAGQIILPDGSKSYFKGTCLDLNPAGATEIAKDKAYSTFFMQNLNYPTIEGEAFFTDRWCTAIKSKRNAKMAFNYALKLGFPVIVKPNSLSQGAGVFKVYGKQDFFRAVKSIPLSERVFLVQRFIQGNDYRIVVLDNEIISAYRRLPLSVIGDGDSTIKTLLLKKQTFFEKTGRDTVINISDSRIQTSLKRQHLSMRSVLAQGRHVILLDNANLSTGGDAVDVTPHMHPSYKEMAIQLTKDMGLRYCGVDIMTQSAITAPCKDYSIIEINAAPGLDHYADIGEAQKQIVDDMYLKVLLAIKRRS